MTADQYLARCADRLRGALSAENVLLPTMLGLRDLIAAAASGSPLQLDTAAEVSRHLFALAPRIAEAVAGRLTADHVFYGLGCANGALSCTTGPRRTDLITFAAMFEAEIKAIYLRDRITAGAAIDLAHMLARNPPSAAPFVPGALTVH